MSRVVQRSGKSPGILLSAKYLGKIRDLVKNSRISGKKVKFNELKQAIKIVTM